MAGTEVREAVARVWEMTARAAPGHRDQLGDLQETCLWEELE